MSPNSLWLAVEAIESPGNLGTIIRTAEAAGAGGTFVLGPESDPYDPATPCEAGLTVLPATKSSE